MESKDDPQQRDLHVGVLIISIAAAMGLFCLEMVLSAVPFISLSGPLLWMYRVLALLILGYVTGCTAMSEKTPPNLHAVMLGFFLMQARTLILFLQYIMSPEEVIHTVSDSILRTIFIIPLMLLGCGVAQMKNRARKQAG